MPIIPYLLIAFLGGVAIRSFLGVPTELALGSLGLVVGFLVILFLKQKLIPHPLTPSPSKGVGEEKRNYFSFQGVKHWAVPVVFLFFLLGILRFDFYERKIGDDQLHLHYGEEMVLEGTVVKSVPKTNSEQLVVETELGKLRVVKGLYPKFKYGDVVSLSGEISEPKPFGNYDTPKQLAKEQIYAEMIFPNTSPLLQGSARGGIFSFLFSIKESFEEKLRQILPEPHSSLANGMLLGNEGALSAELKDAFRKSGTIHILVLSGYNITIVGLFFLAFFGVFVREKFAWMLAALGIVLFTLMTGAEPPAIRAAIMGIIGLMAMASGRQNLAWLALLWSAFLMILWNPMLLAFDGSFQLSFLATLGLIAASSWFSKKLFWLPKMMFVKESVVATLSAQLFVLPLIISWGSEVSYLSPIANAVVAGIVPYVMFFSFAGGLLGFVSVVLGKMVSAAAYVLISLQILTAEAIAGFSPAVFHLNYAPTFVLAFVYAILFYWAYKTIKARYDNGLA